jgi:adenine deaminase
VTRLPGDEQRAAAADVALGSKPADVIVAGGTLANVYTGELHRADIAICGQMIAAIGDVDRAHGPDTTVVDATGMTVAPGLLDQHAHVHESQIDISQFAAAVSPHGTTGVATDFYGEVVVSGVRAARMLLDVSADLPIKVWFMAGVPAYFQNLPFGHSGSPSREEMLEMLSWEDCYGMTDASASRTVAGDAAMRELIGYAQAHGKKVSGHGAEVRGERANAWMAYTRVLDDHESTSAEEAVEKARLGIHVVVREGSSCYNLDEVVKAITVHGVDSRRFCLCTDVPPLLKIVEEGHIDFLVRRLIQAGVPAVDAIRMATLNTAECLQVADDVGAVAPGKRADLILVGDLEEFQVDTVIADGAIVARAGKLVIDVETPAFPEWVRDTVRLPRESVPDDFALNASKPSGTAQVRVIGARGDVIITEELHETLPIAGGRVHADPERDIAKIAAIERVRGSGQIGVGLIRGFGLTRGALATTFNSQAENLMIVGTNDEDMAYAANVLRECGGGFVAVDEGRVVALLPLPLFGLESDEDYLTAAAQLRAVNDAARSLGCEMPDPFSTLGFVGIPVEVGTLKIAPEGLVDVWSGRVVELEVA